VHGKRIEELVGKNAAGQALREFVNPTDVKIL
jgi:hypothetical protein